MTPASFAGLDKPNRRTCGAVSTHTDFSLTHATTLEAGGILIGAAIIIGIDLVTVALMLRQ